MVFMAKIEGTVSKRFSLKGYNLGTWVHKNKDSLKTILSLLLGFLGTGLGGSSVLLITLFGTATAVGTRLVLDLFDYFVSEVIAE
jgi:hypothetical protein